MPPNETCPHCGELILDWHNEWYEAVQRRAIYSGQAAMDCPLCRQAVLWFESTHYPQRIPRWRFISARPP
jgi:hypothetical protein